MAGPYISHGLTMAATSCVGTAEVLSSLKMVPGPKGPRMAQRTPWAVELSGCLRWTAINGRYFTSVAGFLPYPICPCPTARQAAD